TVNLNDGASVDNRINGNNGTSSNSTLNFNFASEGTNFSGDAANGQVNINGETFLWENFDQLVGLILAAVQADPAANIAVTVSSGPSAPPAPQELCDVPNVVKVFRTPSGAFDIYAGFPAAPPNGFQIAWFQNPQAGEVYGFEDNAWRVRLAEDGAIEVLRDGQVIDRTCRWR
ncbi:MAG: hypothetical protein ACLFTK_14920, partial [Anaerolineales bacterium]